MNTHPIAKDRRYTVTREWTGKEKPQFVIRFCETWVDSRSNYPNAVLRAIGYKMETEGKTQ